MFKYISVFLTPLGNCYPMGPNENIFYLEILRDRKMKDKLMHSLLKCSKIRLNIMVKKWDTNREPA